MLRVAKLTDYAILVMTHLARGGEAGCLNARDVADRTDVPLPTVSKLLKRLAREGLVVSSRGAKGGYRLAKGPGLISVAEVIAAIEGPIAMTECSTHGPGLCEVEGNCSVRSNWQRINVAVHAALSSISLAEMAGPTAGAALVQLSPRQPHRLANLPEVL